MHLELPERLLVTRDVLTRSLPTHPLERAPAMPAGLAAELNARFTRIPTHQQESASVSWIDKVRSFLATPGFGAVAAAVVILGIAIPMLSTDHQGPRESFRGGNSVAVSGDQVRILFVGENTAIRSAVDSSGNFEASALVSVANAEAAQAAKGPKVIVDFTAGTISAFRADGMEVSNMALPSDSRTVSSLIAKTVSGL